ncbi:hypothetical protein PAHAL_2G481300 [Panicum hallii]|uniref:Uncharacterized protein n=1 Tax=Panicum hallii TaxID=206008 RepID=A0A2T8KT86_9POAL|nr:hypothetical protein PAHAL_2G481300 [Panicum hallii]
MGSSSSSSSTYQQLHVSSICMMLMQQILVNYISYTHVSIDHHRSLVASIPVTDRIPSICPGLHQLDHHSSSYTYD